MNALSIDLRKRVMEYVDSGHSYREASVHFSINESSVYRWSKLRKAIGSLEAVLVPRSPHKLPDKELLEYIKKHPDAYLREIADHFKCGITTVHDALRRNAITYKKTKNIHKERDSQKREDFIKIIKDIPKENLVYSDESGIDEFLYRDHARAPRGEKVIGEVSGKRFERQSIVAAKCGKQILAPFGYHGTCNSELFNFWLETQLITELKKGQTVILDNAPIHKSDKTRKLIEDAGCKLLFLPPYSPDLNPIEHTWSHIKKNIRSNMHNCNSLQYAVQNFFS